MKLPQFWFAPVAKTLLETLSPTGPACAAGAGGPLGTFSFAGTAGAGAAAAGARAGAFFGSGSSQEKLMLL